MAANYQIFKGGYCASRDDRLAINQRPADGHLKSATWEDYSRLNRDRFRCGVPTLEVGDVIALHTTLTFGLIEAFGIAVTRAEEGLKFKVVVSDGGSYLTFISVQPFQYDEAQKKYVKSGTVKTLDAFDDIGNAPLFYAGYSSVSSSALIANPVSIGLQVVALPSGGLKWDFDIETRLHMRQSVRPPARGEGCC